jgi:predicted DNA-binding WGR domain protein
MNGQRHPQTWLALDAERLEALAAGENGPATRETQDPQKGADQRGQDEKNPDLRGGAETGRRAGQGGFCTPSSAGGRNATHAPDTAGMEREIRRPRQNREGRAMNALTLRRIDPAKHMARFYAMDVQRDLFGCMLLVKQWGRIGTHGRRVGERHATEALAVAAMQRQAERKRRRGYR